MSIKFRSMLITPRISAEYLANLPIILASFEIDYIMYRHDTSDYTKPFCEILASFPHIKKLFNLRGISHIHQYLQDFDGLHLKGDNISLLKPLRKKLDSKIIGYSAHSADEVMNALDLGASYCTLSPIFPSTNKGSPLGINTLESIPLSYRAKVFALGGISKENVIKLKNLGLLGFAGISYFRLV